MALLMMDGWIQSSTTIIRVLHPHSHECWLVGCSLTRRSTPEPQSLNCVTDHRSQYPIIPLYILRLLRYVRGSTWDSQYSSPSNHVLRNCILVRSTHLTASKCNSFETQPPLHFFETSCRPRGALTVSSTTWTTLLR